MSMEFDGQAEINLRLERGQSYGLSKDQYGALAHISMAAFRWAGVEPCSISLLANEPGCDVILFGHAFQFTIRMQPAKQCSTLFALPLDSQLSGCGVELHRHEFNGSDYVGCILAIILRHEGAQFMSPEECDEFVRGQLLKNPMKPRPIWE